MFRILKEIVRPKIDARRLINSTAIYHAGGCVTSLFFFALNSTVQYGHWSDVRSWSDPCEKSARGNHSSIVN